MTSTVHKVIFAPSYFALIASELFPKSEICPEMLCLCSNKIKRNICPVLNLPTDNAQLG